MAEIEVKDASNNITGTVSHGFDVDAHTGLLHQSVVRYLANQRQGTHSTKTRGLVSGGGRKPYRQKKTGRSRAGSSRSPLRRGGGTVFGPHPRDYTQKMPKKARRLALKAAISRKIADGEVTVIDSFGIDAPSTKSMVGILQAVGVRPSERVVVVTGAIDRNVWLSGRNIPAVSVTPASDLNIFDVAASTRLVMSREAFEALNERMAAK